MRRTWMLALSILALAALAWPSHVMAATVDPAAGGADPGVVTDTALGVLAAVGCVMFGRALLAGAVLPGVIAGAVATCGYMIFDGLTHER